MTLGHACQPGRCRCMRPPSPRGERGIRDREMTLSRLLRVESPLSYKIGRIIEPKAIGNGSRPQKGPVGAGSRPSSTGARGGTGTSKKSNHPSNFTLSASLSRPALAHHTNGPDEFELLSCFGKTSCRTAARGYFWLVAVFTVTCDSSEGKHATTGAQRR